MATVRWRAWYSNTEWTEGPFHLIDRSRLTRFDIYPDELALRPVWGIDVPPDKRLTYCTRNFITLGGSRRFVAIVALDDDVWIITDEGYVSYQHGWGTDVVTGPPDFSLHSLPPLTANRS